VGIASHENEVFKTLHNTMVKLYVDEQLRLKHQMENSLLFTPRNTMVKLFVVEQMRFKQQMEKTVFSYSSVLTLYNTRLRQRKTLRHGSKTIPLNW
jgi:uncharacterized protein Veg